MHGTRITYRRSPHLLSIFILLLIPGVTQAGNAGDNSKNTQGSVFTALQDSRLLPGHNSENTHGPEYLIERLAYSLDPDEFENHAAFEEYIQEILSLFPIDPNRSSPFELRLIPELNERLIEAILEYREQQPIRTADDLLKIPGIGPATVEKLRPWVTFASSGNQRSSFFDGLNVEQLFRYQQRFPQAMGYVDGEDRSPHYPGMPARIYHRHTLTANRFSANLTQVKLPGEPWVHPQGFDFTSANVEIRNTGPVRNLIFGDYALRFGQGLVLWSSASFGKGGTAHTAPYRRNHGITPYRSSGQIRFFRGVAMDVAAPVPLVDALNETELILSAFYSARRRSAVAMGGDTIRPPSSNPYHRTETERSRRNNIVEYARGGNIALEHRNWRVGMTYASYEIDRPVIPHPQSSPLQGSDNASLGTDISMNIAGLKLFGEYATRLGRSVRVSGDERHATEYQNSVAGNESPANGHENSESGHENSESGHENPAAGHEYPEPDANTPGPEYQKRNARIAGIMGSFTEKADWVFSVRKYDPGYWSEYGGGFGEGVGAPVNQAGWYFGFRLRPADQFLISGYLDRFFFPAPRRGLTRSSGGWEPVLEMQYRRSRQQNYRLRFRYKERLTERIKQDAYLRDYRVCDSEYRFTARFQKNWQIDEPVFLRSQFDYIRTGNPDRNHATGMAISQIVRWNALQSLRFDVNWTLFETDDFSSRIYLFEYDLTYAMASTMLYGTGQRSYIVIRYRPADRLLAEFKYSRMRYLDRPAIGSGHDMTAGSRRYLVGFQLRLTY